MVSRIAAWATVGVWMIAIGGLSVSELEEPPSDAGEDRAAPKPAEPALLVLYVSVGLVYVWYAIAFLFFGISRNVPLNGKGLLHYLPIVCSVLGMLLGYTMVPRLAAFMDYGKRRNVVFCLFACLMAGIAFLFVGFYCEPATELVLVPAGCILLGASVSILSLYCKEFACGLDRSTFHLCICSSAITGVGAFGLCSMLDPIWQMLIFAAASLVGIIAVVAFTGCLNLEDSPEVLPLQDVFNKLGLIPRTGWFLALYGNVAGIKCVELLAHGLEDDHSQLFLAVVAFIAGIAVALVVVLKNPDRTVFGHVQRLTFPLLVIGLLPWSLLVELPAVFEIAWVFAVCAVLVFSNYDTHYYFSRNRDLPAIYSFTLTFRSFIKGLALGTSLWALVFLFSPSGALTPLLELVYTIALCVVIALFPEEPDRFEPKIQPVLSAEAVEPVKKPGAWKHCCMEMAAEYGLTHRESDILALLLKALTIDHIGSALFISPHTVKTHVYHIYQKIGVKNRGELSALFQERLDKTKAHES